MPRHPERKAEIMKTVLRLLALTGAAISAYLLFLRINGTITSVAGCGDDGGCANVLGSRWSQFFGVPVSAFAAGLYLALFGLTFRPVRPLLLTTCFLLFGAAAWFMGLQVFVIRSFCPWCLATHAIGLLAAGSLLMFLRPLPAPRIPALSAALLMGGLVAGQVWGPAPETHAVADDDSGGIVLPVHSRGEGRLLDFAGKQFLVEGLPHAGPANAARFMVEYFDYACDTCRDLHGDLEALRKLHPEEVGIILLPTPLDRSCNPLLAEGVKSHEGACELARLSLAVWLANPQAHGEAHRLLFTRPTLTPAEARQKILALVPASDLDKALADPWIDELIAANVADYALLVKASPRMPKLRIKDGKVMSGVSKTTDSFLKLISGELDLKSP
jgi:uncharacterized membrane protein